MSRIVILIFTFLISSVIYGASIDFKRISFDEALKLAKKENKAVLLYFHFNGCAPCAKMEKETFTDGKVASYYNSNFIAVEVNSSYEDGKITSKKFGITINPAFIYYDSSGKELHKIVGFQSTKDFLQQGKKALNKFQSLSYFKQQYRTGKRDAAFLFEYAYRLKQSKELTPDVIVSYLKTQSDKELAKEQNIKFIYEFAIHDFKPVIAFDSREYNFMLSNIDLFTDYFKKEQVEVRLVWIAFESSRIKSYLSKFCL